MYLEEQWFCSAINSQLTGKSSATVVLALKNHEHVKSGPRRPVRLRYAH